MPDSTEPAVSAEDRKLVTLARASRARAQSREGAAVRDDIGRTYAAAEVALPSLRLTALQAAVAAAVSSGADRLGAAAIVSNLESLRAEDAAVAGDVGIANVLLADPTGALRGSTT